jgi:hypothetical protein
MNLFLWFRDDWYWLQFLMLATGVLCKEFIRWDRDGRRAHSRSLHLPPYIYPEIFLLGMVVQGLFAVTLMTLSAAAVLCALNLIRLRATGLLCVPPATLSGAGALPLIQQDVRPSKFRRPTEPRIRSAAAYRFPPVPNSPAT